MYTVCTYRIGVALRWEFIDISLHLFVTMTLAAWLAAFAGFLRNLAKKLR